MLAIALLSLTIVMKPGIIPPSIEAEQSVCQSYYTPLVHTLRRAWPKSDAMRPPERKRLLININAMLRELSRQGRLDIACAYTERDNANETE